MEGKVSPPVEKHAQLSTYALPVILGIAAALSFLGCEALYYSAADANLTENLIWIRVIFSGLILLGAVFCFATSLLGLVFQSDTEIVRRWFLSALFLAAPLLIVLIFDPSRLLRNHHIFQIERNAEPLIVAIEKYTADHQHPPDTIDLIVPTYISKLPPTGESRHKIFEYERLEGSKTTPWRISLEYGSEFASTPNLLVYTANQNYSHFEGQEFERVGKWIYIPGRMW